MAFQKRYIQPNDMGGRDATQSTVQLVWRHRMRLLPFVTLRYTRPLPCKPYPAAVRWAAGGCRERGGDPVRVDSRSIHPHEQRNAGDGESFTYRYRHEWTLVEEGPSLDPVTTPFHVIHRCVQFENSQGTPSRVTLQLFLRSFGTA